MKIFYNKIFKNYFLMMISLFISEIIFKCVCNLSLFDFSTLRVFIGINFISLLFGFLYSFSGRIAGNILTFITTLILNVYAIIQAGFQNYIGVFVSFGASSQMGAVRDYIGDYLDSFKISFWIILIPVVLLLLYYIFIEPKVHILQMNEQIDFADKFDSEERKQINEKNAKKRYRNSELANKISAIIIMVILIFAYYFTLTNKAMQNELQLKSNIELIKNPDMPNIAMSQFGYSAYILIDIKSVLLPSTETQNFEEPKVKEEQKRIEQEESDYTRKIDDSVWEKIINEETNANYKTLNNYFINQEITDKNDYTGMFKDKNLVVIMMESVNTIALDSKYYPNISKLYNEGWSFDNAYSPRNSCSTGNNEMSGMTSLYTINNSCTANNYKDNVYPEAIFNLFNNAGYTTSSYHNYTEQYYFRKTIHPNMGSGHYYGVEELGIPYSNVYEEWPSDVDLIKKVLNLTQDQDKFMAWITSVSSHQPYTQNSKLGQLYFNNFANTNYNASLKRYMSKVKVLDDAIGELLTGLEEQGKLQDTVILLFADHYPYGLTNATLNSYFDYDVSKNYEVDKTPFIIYNSEMTPTKFSNYTTYMNITPTVANLFDLDYDPRYYTGKDLFSKSYEDRIIYADGSWQDKKAFYNGTTGKVIYNTEGDEYTAEEIKEINVVVRNRIAMSNLAIRTNYFNYLFKKFEEHKVSNINDNVTIQDNINNKEESIR